ncbi:MAG TPA: hypothetical protein VMC42_07160 [Methanoregulaceae archaeon]|nr:hypothetical protein [Methanoregulaceae archaeon]
MVASHGEDGVSEIIGFILIIAIITIVASLYLTYVVPSQGRDLEIAHMALVQNEFLDYKTSVDSLWINEQNVTIINPFILGTSPGTSQGTFLNLPLFQPLPSSGTLSVNGQNGGTTVKIDATQYRTGISPDLGNSDNATIPVGGGSFTLPTAPNHIYITVTTGTTRYTNPSPVPQKSTIGLYNSSKNSWNITISAVPVVDLNATNSKYTTNIVVNSSITKLIGTQSLPVSRELTIKTDADPNTPYPVDLIDIINQFYNLDANITYPQVVNTFSQNIGSSNPIAMASVRIEYAYSPPVSSSTVVPAHSTGSLEYQSHNNYWIQQNYVYQMGGVFVTQSDGAVAKIPPEISITRSPSNPSIALMEVMNITINPSSSSSVSSNGLVHADTLSQVIDGKEIPSYANSDIVTITIDNSANSATQALTPAWNVAVDRICLIAQNTGGVPYTPGATSFDPNTNWFLVQHGSASNNYQTRLQVRGGGSNSVTLINVPVNLNVYVEPESSGAQPGA